MERKVKIVTVIAGPNGAGKTSLQSLLRQAHLVECNIVNIDAITIDENLLPNDPLRYQKELNRLVDKKFKELCLDVIENNQDFAFECNLRENQIKYLALFDDAGYKINLVYLWLDSLELSLDRVKTRVAQGGHNVGRNSIESNYYEGLNNLNDSFQDWDKLYIIDNSKDISKNDIENLPLILYIENGNIEYISPSIDNNILESNFPKIAKNLLKQDT